MKLSVNNLTKRYKDKVALNGVTFEMQQGIYAILGLNGSGKTTIIKLLTDLLKRTEGDVLFDGEDILKMGDAYRAKIGYVPQEQAYIGEFTGRSYLYYMAELKGIKKADAKSDIDALLKQFSLWDAADKKMKQYSTGMKQRAILCQALLGNPQIIILDEPTIGLDLKERINFKEYIKKIADDKIIIYCTHIISDVQDIADYIILIKNGSIIKNCKMDELFDSGDSNENVERIIMSYLK